MNSSDEGSELSFFEIEKFACLPVNKSACKKFRCKVLGCSKAFSHSPSLCRHYRTVHVDYKPPKTESISNADNVFETAQSHLNSFEISNLPVHDSYRQGEGATDTTILDLQQQMLMSGQGPLFACFQTLLEVAQQSDPHTVPYLRSFYGMLDTALNNREVRECNGTGAAAANSLAEQQFSLHSDILVGHSMQQSPAGHIFNNSPGNIWADEAILNFPA